MMTTTDALSDRPPTKVYEPTVTGLPSLRAYIAGLVERRPLIWHLARSDMKAENYGTVMGQLWILLDPLLMAAVYYLVRTVVRPISGDDRYDLILHLIAGIFFYQLTSRAVNHGARSLINNRALILNSSFPRAVFPIVSVVGGLLDFAPQLVVYFLLHAALGQPLTSALVFLPLLVLMQVLFTLGLTLIFAPVTVRFRDTKKFLPYTTRIWMFATPILWKVSEMPSHLGWLKANPLFPFFAALEQIFDGVAPAAQYMLAAGLWAVLAMAVGTFTFLRLERDVASHF